LAGRGWQGIKSRVFGVSWFGDVKSWGRSGKLAAPAFALALPGELKKCG